MTCEDRKDMLLLLALGSIDAEERLALEVHLRSGCPACLGEMAGATALVGHLGLAAPAVPPPARVKTRLMQAVAGSPRLRSPIPFPAQPPAPERRARIWLAPLVSAALAAGLTGVLVLSLFERERRLLSEELAATRDRVRGLESQLAAYTGTLQALGSPTIQVVALEAAGPQPAASARVFWDRSRGVWHFYAANMKPSAAGRTYQLWFITTDERKVSAGLFDVGPDGQGSLVTTVPPDVGALALTAVTDEPAGGAPQPTGSIQLVGKLRT